MNIISQFPKTQQHSFRIIQAVKVPPEACVRKLDRDIGFFLTHDGLRVLPGERPDPFQVAHCTAWIQKFARPRKSINFDITSYGLKHLVEVWPFEDAVWPDTRGYCSNGALILAALNLGYKFASVGNETSPNCCFNMRFNRNRKWHERIYGREVYLPFDDEAGGKP